MSMEDAGFMSTTFRLGKIFVPTVGVLAEAYNEGHPVTTSDIEQRIPSVSRGVRHILGRLSSLYAYQNEQQEFLPLLEVSDHPELLWYTNGYSYPRKNYSFTPSGFRRSVGLIIDLAIARDNTSNIDRSKHQLFESLKS